MQIEGRQAVLTALQKGQQIEKITLLRSAHGQIIKEILQLAREQRIPVVQLDRNKLDQIGKTHNHQGVIALAPAWSYTDFSELLHKCRTKEGVAPFIVILDHIKDPHNFGSIIRTADAAGVDGIIIPQRRSVGITEVVVKVSAGAVSAVPIVRVTNLSQTIDELKDKGFWIIGTDAEGKQEIYDVDLTIPIALLIGSEGQGIGRALAQKSDHLTKLPMGGEVTSLNAAVAAGVCMFEVVRQRRLKSE